MAAEKITDPDECFKFFAEYTGTSYDKDSLFHAVYNSTDERYLYILVQAFMLHGYNQSAWMLREYTRIKCGSYLSISIPSSIEGGADFTNLVTKLPLLFPHISKDDPSLIAYTPDPTYGRADRQVKIAPGRFFKKYYPDLSDNRIRALSDVLRRVYSTDDVLYATTVAEIENIYINGPDSSCMRYPVASSHFSRWGCHIHPSAVYAVPWIRGAYLQNKDGKITARCLVYDNPNDPNDRRYTRLYGDEVLLRYKLERLGYKYNTLENVLIKKIPAQRTDGEVLYDTWIMPYIDDKINSRDAAQWVVHENDDYFRVVRSSSSGTILSATSTKGIIGHHHEYLLSSGTEFYAGPPKQVTCGHCGAVVLERNTTYSDFHEHSVCGECRPQYVYAYTDSSSLNHVFMRMDQTVHRGTTFWVNDQAILDELLLTRLDTTAYPPRSGSARVEFVRNTVTTAAGKTIRREDSVIATNGQLLHYPSEIMQGSHHYLPRTMRGILESTIHNRYFRNCENPSLYQKMRELEAVGTPLTFASVNELIYREDSYTLGHIEENFEDLLTEYETMRHQETLQPTETIAA